MSAAVRFASRPDQFSRLSAGNRITSRMVGLSVRIIIRRSQAAARRQKPSRLQASARRQEQIR